MDYGCRLVSSLPPRRTKPNDDGRLLHKFHVRIKGVGQSQGDSSDNPRHFGDMVSKQGRTILPAKQGPIPLQNSQKYRKILLFSFELEYLSLIRKCCLLRQTPCHLISLRPCLLSESQVLTPAYS